MEFMGTMFDTAVTGGGCRRMRKIEKKFGFYPETLEVDTGAISIRPLPELDEVVNRVLSSEQVDDNWMYVPLQRTCDLMSGRLYKRPFSARVFGLPRTQRLKIEKASGDGHADFYLWILSFFLGMRLTSTEAGFVDATPSKPGTLVDFLLGSRSGAQHRPRMTGYGQPKSRTGDWLGRSILEGASQGATECTAVCSGYPRIVSGAVSQRITPGRP